MKQKLEKLILEYGAIALVLHFTVMAIVVVGAYFGIKAGWTPDGTAGTAGTWAAVYFVHLATKIPRFAITLALTPVVARGLHWLALRPGLQHIQWLTRFRTRIASNQNGGGHVAGDVK